MYSRVLTKKEASIIGRKKRVLTVLALLIPLLFSPVICPVSDGGRAYASTTDREGLHPTKPEFEVAEVTLSGHSFSLGARDYDFFLYVKYGKTYTPIEGTASWSVLGNVLILNFPDYGTGQFTCVAADPFLNPKEWHRCNLSLVDMYRNKDKKLQYYVGKLKEYFTTKWFNDVNKHITPVKRIVMQWEALAATMTPCVHKPGERCRFSPAFPFSGSKQGPVFISGSEISLQVASDPTVKLMVRQGIRFFLKRKDGKAVRDIHGNIIPMPLKSFYEVNSNNTASQTVKNLAPGDYIYHASAAITLTRWKDSPYKVTFKVASFKNLQKSPKLTMPLMPLRLGILSPKKGQTYTGTIPVKITLPRMKTKGKLVLTWSLVGETMARMLMRKTVTVKPGAFYETKQDVGTLVARAGGEVGKLQLNVSLAGSGKTAFVTFYVGILGNPVQRSENRRSGSINLGKSAVHIGTPVKKISTPNVSRSSALKSGASQSGSLSRQAREVAKSGPTKGLSPAAGMTGKTERQQPGTKPNNMQHTLPLKKFHAIKPVPVNILEPRERQKYLLAGNSVRIKAKISNPTAARLLIQVQEKQKGRFVTIHPRIKQRQAHGETVAEFSLKHKGEYRFRVKTEGKNSKFGHWRTFLVDCLAKQLNIKPQSGSLKTISPKTGKVNVNQKPVLNIPTRYRVH